MNKEDRDINYNKAKNFVNSGNPGMAINLLRAIIEFFHDDYEAYNLSGVCNAMIGQIPKALNEFEKAVKLNPNFPDTYSNIGILLSQVHEKEEAVKYFNHALKLSPQNIDTLYNLAVAYKELGLLENAIDTYNKCISYKNDFAQAYMNKALLELTLGDYKNGWKNYEWGFKSGDRVERNLRGERWKGEDINGKSIYIYSNQGFGDTIQFIRYLPKVQELGAKVIFECQRELFDLLEPLGFWSEIVAMNFDLSVTSEYDYHIPLLSLPLIFETEVSTIPVQRKNIRPTKKACDKWSEIFHDSKKKKAGIVWSGNPNHKNDKNRSCQLTLIKELFKLENIQFYNLQLNKTDVSISEKIIKEKLIDYTSNISDFNDTAALIDNIDLVISVDTSVAHLSAAMNKETWVMIPFVPDWRWMLNKDDNPWYPSVKLFRQPKIGDWESVVNSIQNKLSKL
ncbi:MAG: tetratricopeptide repeat protein [Melioribacteraceae bacterium]|nr:tetratricopeptide repeat protein [Melioribacteraceae bacterium]